MVKAHKIIMPILVNFRPLKQLAKDNASTVEIDTLPALRRRDLVRAYQ